MAVNLAEPTAVLPVRGVELAATAAGIRYQGRDDLALIAVPPGATAAAMFTSNAFCAAPVALARRHLAASGGQLRALLINSGNANAGTGSAGHAAAVQCCQALAEELGCPIEQVLPFSTGVIGERFPAQRLCAALPALLAGRGDDWMPVARAVMTTDTVPKAVSRRIDTAAGPVTISGVAKGAGMIRPDLATMLAFIACDARIEAAHLQDLLRDAVAQSFNRITIDGDTSTNDAAVLLAAGGPALAPGDEAWDALSEALTAVCVELAQALVRDAEGATRFVTVAIEGAADIEEARAVAYTVAHSPLVKTALFAGDPNWGRILAAVGRSGIRELEISGIDLFLDELPVLRGGEPAAEYSEAAGAAVAARAEYTIRVALGRGDAATALWTSDLSYEYVRINAEYRS